MRIGRGAVALLVSPHSRGETFSLGGAKYLVPSLKTRSKRSRCYSQKNSVAWVDPQLEVARNYDGIFVLGGGVRPDGTLPEWVKRRLDASADLQRLQEEHCPIVCLGGGTPHKPPPIDSSGFPIHESTICADYLMTSSSIHPDLILKEVSSYDTVGNVYFALTIHALPAKWTCLAVVTSAFHMPRSAALFEDIFELASKDLVPPSKGFKFDFFPVSDSGVLSEDVLEERRTKEANSLSSWKTSLKQLNTFAAFHAWLYKTHLCYSVSRQSEFGGAVEPDGIAMKSY